MVVFSGMESVVEIDLTGTEAAMANLRRLSGGARILTHNAPTSAGALLLKRGSQWPPCEDFRHLRSRPVQCPRQTVCRSEFEVE